MDTNNWRPTAPDREPAMETGDWRAQLQPDSRQRIVNKIMETLKRHLPFSGPEGLEELNKIAVRFEEKIYTAAVSQSDYLRKISLKMLTMETKSQNAMPNSLPANSGNSNKPPDPGASMQAQGPNQGQPLPIPLSANQSRAARQQLLSQNLQNNMVSAATQSSAGLTSVLPPVSGLSQAPVTNAVGQNPNLQNISGVSQMGNSMGQGVPNSLGNSMGQGVPSNMFNNPQRQMPTRQQVVPQQQQQQQQPQYASQYLYQQQQLHQQLMKQKLQQGNLLHPLVQSHIQKQQQQQQQNVLQPNQLQSQQPGMQASSVLQPTMMQSAPLPSHQQSQPSSVQQTTQPMLQQHPQSVLWQQQHPQQAAGIHQQQMQMMQQPLLPPQQQPQQQLMGQQTNATNMQQNPLIGQQNSVGDIQQQQLMAQQSNISGMHQQHLGSQSYVPGLQQQLHGTQPSNSTMQANQQSMHMLQQSKVPMQQQTQQGGSNLLPTQGQQSQPQPSQQQMMSQIQSQPAQLQQQPNPLQRDMQQRLQPSASLDSTAQTAHANGGDWQEEVYQKIKSMKEMYLPELNDIYQKIAAKLQQHESLPQQPMSEQIEKLKVFKTMLERMLTLLQVQKQNIMPSFKEKLGSYEKQIIQMLNSNRPGKPMPPMQQGQLPESHMQSQITQVQSHENQRNPQLQSMNLQGSVPTIQQNNVSSLQHNSLSSSGVSTSHQNAMNPMQPGSNMRLILGTESQGVTMRDSLIMAIQCGVRARMQIQEGYNVQKCSTGWCHFPWFCFVVPVGFLVCLLLVIMLVF